MHVHMKVGYWKRKNVVNESTNGLGMSVRFSRQQNLLQGSFPMNLLPSSNAKSFGSRNSLLDTSVFSSWGGLHSLFGM